MARIRNYLFLTGAAAGGGTTFQPAWAMGSTVTIRPGGYGLKKNVASQTVGAQLASATDGSAVTTGTTTVYVTGDGGTQAAGTGTVTHEGNGCWSYAPTQAETNYDHVAFTFVNAAAIAVTVQIYTTFPQTGDSFARIGSAGAGLTAIGDTRVANLDAAVSSRLASASYTAPDNADIVSILGFVDTEVAAIKAKTDNLPASPAATGDIPSAATIASSVLTTAMTESYGTDGGTVTLAQGVYEMLAMQEEKSVAGTTVTVKKRDGSTTAMTFTLDDSASPTSITRAS